jgi:hypothetical protein
MRRIEIVEEPNQTYKWTAIDKATRQSLLRLSDLNQLRDVCERLEWKVIDVKWARKLKATPTRRFISPCHGLYVPPIDRRFHRALPPIHRHPAASGPGWIHEIKHDGYPDGTALRCRRPAVLRGTVMTGARAIPRCWRRSTRARSSLAS